MTWKIIDDAPRRVKSADADIIALALRIGLGAVFITGGWWKLSRALDPARAQALVAQYTADKGYINAFFQDYLFSDGALLTPLSFLIILSAFELLSGVALVAGFAVRALSFIYAFLLWSFVMALPVITTTIGASGGLTDQMAAAPSHYSPAMLVQIRDIALSGMFFVLMHLGAGAVSVDQVILKRGAPPDEINWNVYGLLLRLCVASVFMVGGFFAGYDHIKSFIDAPILLAAIGIILASGHLLRLTSIIACAVVTWYCAIKLNLEIGFWDNVNAIKREIAFLAACCILIAYQGGQAFRPLAFLKSPKTALFGREGKPAYR